MAAQQTPPEAQGSIGNERTGETALATETTALLPSTSSYGYNGAETEADDELESSDIEANEFDHLLARAESHSTGLGVEPASIETAMLRGPRKYSVITKGSRRSSFASVRRKKSFQSNIGSEVPTDEDDGNNEVSKSPFHGVSVARFWLIFGGTLISFFVACFDSTIMVSSHPIITSYFHSSNSASWLSTAFLLTSTSFQPLFGRLSDTIGRKPPLVFSATVFLLATIWCGVAQSMMSFIMARAVCGLGAGGMMSMGSIITSDLVPIEIRGAYQSYLNITYGAGSALGAALGGAIADRLGWRWEFYVQVPAIAFSLATACFTIPRDLGLRGTQQKSIWEAMKVFDFAGSILLTTSITFLILGLNLGGNVYEWKHPFVISSFIIFSICFPLFIYTESRVPLPIMPLHILTQNPRASLILSNAIGATIANATIFNIPLFFQAVLLESATESGLRLVVPSIASSAVGTATGFLITWNKRLKAPLVAGTVLLFIGTTSLSLMRRGLPDWAYVAFLIPSSMGSGFMFPGTFMAVLAVSEQAEQAVVTSTLILWRSMGNVLGVAISSLVLQNALRVYLEQKVQGPESEDIIEKVRSSVKAIAKLAPPYRDQVIDAYAASLGATFMVSALLSIITIVLTVRLQLPRLGHRK